MESRRHAKNTQRPPLSERQPRTIHPKSPGKGQSSATSSSPRMPHRESLMPTGNLSVCEKAGTNLPNIENKRLSAVADEVVAGSNRDSQASTTSQTSVTKQGKRKTHVGPWQLGKTLGKGATGRVRLAKHALTGQVAAVKIVSKKSAALVQSASMAKMDKDASEPASNAGIRTMPYGIEREVIIMKLIEHPNIIRLYDIWENRGELYLVIEYVEGGELFDYVSSNGTLHEGEAVRLFRQIIAALSYCHNFRICHRDLKPENILIDTNRNVKLADFGMAALQPQGTWLRTSCGSPHYAAPEIVHGYPYRGNKADIWSVGIILFAMLNGFLPFDGADLQGTLSKVKKGVYYLPPTLSDEAQDLIQRILQKDPEKRISMPEIWVHPLIKKYAHLDPNPPQTPTTSKAEAYGRTITKRSEVDVEVLRNLRTLWHGEKEDVLVAQLTCEEPTQVKLFYWALVNFREEQLENYPGDPLNYSASDYHHVVKPVPKVAKRSANARGTGHARRASQFSIVSESSLNKDGYYNNPSITASKTTQGSYDPYRASRTPIVQESADPATVFVRQNTDSSRTQAGSRPNVLRHTGTARAPGIQSSMPTFTSEELDALLQSKRSSYSSRSSLASSRRKTAMKRSVSYRRHVSFPHRHNGSISTASRNTPVDLQDRKHSASTHSSRPQTATEAGQGARSTVSLPLPGGSNDLASSPDLDTKEPRAPSQYWKDETRKVSAELSKICEEAFNRSSASSASDVSHQRPIDSPATSVFASHELLPSASKSRPLPETPALFELLDRRQRIIETWGDGDLAVLADVVATLDRRIAAETDRAKAAEKRSASAPTQTATKTRVYDLANTPDTMRDLKHHREEAARAASDPITLKGKEGKTIRIVDPSSPISQTPHLHVRKNKGMPLNSTRAVLDEALLTPNQRGGYDTRFYPTAVLDTIEENPQSPRKKRTLASPTGPRNWGWLGKRNSKVQDEEPPTPPRKNSPRKTLSSGDLNDKGGGSARSGSTNVQQPGTEQEELQDTIERKKTWFKRMFSKTGRAKEEHAQPHCEHEVVNDVDDETDSYIGDGHDKKSKPTLRKSYPPSTSVDAAIAAAAAQPIEISQNWFAKFFHIKPATRVICLQISKTRARKEVIKVLKDWKKYGLRDVVAEKRAGGDLIRARVDACNYLQLKPVQFHAHLYTVLEHGRKANLSLLKFTQEKGAASSFYKVVDTLEGVLKEKGLLISDPKRRRGIEKSLKDADL